MMLQKFSPCPFILFSCLGRISCSHDVEDFLVPPNLYLDKFCLGALGQAEMLMMNLAHLLHQ